MEEGGVSKRGDPNQNKWCDRSGRGELCDLGQCRLGNGGTVASLQLCIERPPGPQEWCLGEQQVVGIPKRDFPYIILVILKLASLI